MAADNGQYITKEEIIFFVQKYAQGEIPDYQASAWAMAVYFKGMTAQETIASDPAYQELLSLSVFEDVDLSISHAGSKHADVFWVTLFLSSGSE